MFSMSLETWFCRTQNGGFPTFFRPIKRLTVRYVNLRNLDGLVFLDLGLKSEGKDGERV